MSSRMPIEELASLPTFYHPTANDAGDEIAIYYDETGRNELYTIDAETGERTQLSDGNVPRDAKYPIRYGPDGNRLYFHQDEGGDEQNDIKVIDRGGVVETLIESEGQSILTDISPDGSRLLYASTVGEQMNLYVFDCDTEETIQITDYEFPTQLGLYSPSGDRIAYATNETEDLDNLDTYVADADGSNPRKLSVGERGAETEVVDWGPRGDRLLLADNSTDASRCGVFDLESESVTWYTHADTVESPVAFLPDGERFLATRTRECAVVPVVYDLDAGTNRELDLPEGVTTVPFYSSYRKTAVLSETEIVLGHQTPTERPSLLVYDLVTDEVRTLVEPEYGEIDPDAFVDCTYERFESHDSLEIEALVYDSGVRPSPVIAKIHGGPPAQDQRSFDLYAQFLVSRGYSVLEVNYRGSTGRGREFKNMINDDWGGDEQADIAAGVKWLADQEWVDDDRIAVVGGSYGGYSTFMQLLQYPDLYAAGVARVGITDLQSLYEESMPHFKTILEKYLGEPDANGELYRERSPITHVSNLQAPLCIIHGVNDPRCPISQARLFRDELEAQGYEEDVDFEYTELEEGHGSSDIDQKIRGFRILSEFLAPVFS